MTLDRAEACALAMTEPQRARVLRRFERAESAGLPGPTAFVLAVLQERTAIYANLSPYDPRRAER